ncbi:hypothetical protein [Pseudomonas phoenicis]|uniref:hypothetical protein n=1 Tax=unclassified Pseudomonas TaxID=196821 RepID=UPI0039A14EC9
MSQKFGEFELEIEDADVHAVLQANGGSGGAGGCGGSGGCGGGGGCSGGSGGSGGHAITDGSEE